MTRPEDIPQEAWDFAQAVESDCINATWNGTAKGTRTISETIIARAIMAAEKRGEEREREACARLCAGHIEVVGSRGRRLEAHEILNEEMHSGLTYAAAIRNRSKQS